MFRCLSPGLPTTIYRPSERTENADSLSLQHGCSLGFVPAQNLSVLIPEHVILPGTNDCHHRWKKAPGTQVTNQE